MRLGNQARAASLPCVQPVGNSHVGAPLPAGQGGHVHRTVHLTRYAATRPRGSSPGLRGCWGLKSVRGRHSNLFVLVLARLHQPQPPVTVPSRVGPRASSPSWQPTPRSGPRTAARSRSRAQRQPRRSVPARGGPPLVKAVSRHPPTRPTPNQDPTTLHAQGCEPDPHRDRYRHDGLFPSGAPLLHDRERYRLRSCWPLAPICLPCNERKGQGMATRARRPQPVADTR